jgi:uncharacterized membrane protein
LFSPHPGRIRDESSSNATSTTIGALIATIRFLFQRRGEASILFRLYRQDMGRAILLGFEFLVAGDIIHTVVVDPTFNNVIVLDLIVLIRTFLSMSLQLELEGRRDGREVNRSRWSERETSMRCHSQF